MSVDFYRSGRLFLPDGSCLSEFLSSELWSCLVTFVRRGGWTAGDFSHVFGAKGQFIALVWFDDVASACGSAAVVADWRRGLQWSRVLDKSGQRAVLKGGEKAWWALADRLRRTWPLHEWEVQDQLAADPSVSKVRDRVLSLLRKAESTTFAAEAEALVAKAQQLQQQYVLDGLVAEGSSAETIRTHRVCISGPYIKHRFRLLGGVARANGCRAILVHPLGLVSVVGEPESCAHTAQMYESLQVQCDYYMSKDPRAEQARMDKQLAPFKRSFLLAYAARISTLLSEVNEHALPEDEVARASAEKALALRGTAVDQKVEDLYSNLRSSSLAVNNWSGYSAGVDAAERSRLGGAEIDVQKSLELST